MSWAIYGSYEVEVWDERDCDASDGSLTPTGYNAAAADLFVFTVRRPIVVVAFLLEVTTAYVVDAVAQVLSLDHRVTHNSDTGRVELATLTAVNAWADGAIKLNEFNGIDVDPGEQLVIEQKVQGTSGGAAAGACNPLIAWYPRSEIRSLMTNLEVVTS